MSTLRLFAAFACCSAVLVAAETAKMPAAEAARLVAEGKAVLVDCREPGEWKDSGVAAPAVLLPKSDFDGDKTQWKRFLEQNKGKQILIYCRSGSRAGTVAKALNEQGVKAANVGGLKDWTAAGLPTREADAPPKAAAPKAKT